MLNPKPVSYTQHYLTAPESGARVYYHVQGEKIIRWTWYARTTTALQAKHTFGPSFVAVLDAKGQCFVD